MAEDLELDCKSSLKEIVELRTGVFEDAKACFFFNLALLDVCLERVGAIEIFFGGGGVLFCCLWDLSF